MDNITKVVLTGGPCAGKTTALQRIENEFTEKGYKVFIVGESATETQLAGAKPHGNLAIPGAYYQKELLAYQLYKEKMYERFAESLPKDVLKLIVCDRGALDNKAYIDEEGFKKILDELGIKEMDLLTSYDQVLHLKTAADGAEEFYTLENNQARSESAEEARKVDQKTLNCWLGHPNLEVFDNKDTFDVKIDGVINAIHKSLGIPEPTQNQRKYILDKDSALEFLKNIPKYKMVRIEQFFRDDTDELCYRKMSDDVSSIYFEIHKKNTNDSNVRIKTMKKLTEDEYLKNLFLSNSNLQTKNRYSFVWNNQYYRIDFFNEIDLCMLEIESTKENKKIIVPDGLVVLEDVTTNEHYHNYLLYKEMNSSRKRVKVN